MTPPDDDEIVEIHLLGLPLRIMAEVQERADELGREFSHVAETEDESVPARLAALSQHLQGQYGAFLTPMQQQIDDATTRGEEFVDVSLKVPRSVRTAVMRLWALLDEADEYCRNGDLLTLAPTPEMLMLRRWYLTQFIDQPDGAEPVPFARYAAPPPV